MKNNQSSHIDYNRQGMRGKLTIPSFVVSYNGEEYFDWEMAVEEEFNSHLVSEIHRVKHVTSEFKYFAQFWWQKLGNLHQQPQSCDRLKEAMCDRFIPVSYKRDLRKKLQRLEQGDMSVQEYFAELQKVMICCGIEEDPEDKVCHFYGGLICEIQNIIYYKDFNTTNQLFQLAMLTEKRIIGMSAK